MTSKPKLEDALRDRIIAEPTAILDDQDVMRALVEANQKAMGGNIIDLRGISMERLENRLDRLEDTHRSVIATAYDNLAGTNQVHRAVLRLLNFDDFDALMSDLNGQIANILQVESLRLVLETSQTDSDPDLSRFGAVLTVVDAGFVAEYINAATGGQSPQVILRQFKGAGLSVFGENSQKIQSEACLTLDLGGARLPGMLVMGGRHPQQFSSQQGTDLLTFFAGVFERTIRRLLL